MRDAELWARLERHDLPPGKTERLGRPIPKLQEALETNLDWAPDYAEQVVTEYLRFLYLSRVSRTQATPSEIIDTIWHLHMQDSAAYLDFCHAIFGEIHHHEPCIGDEEMPRYERQYAATLALYTNEFGQAPPPDIWIHRTEEEQRRDARRLRFARPVGIVAGLLVAFLIFQLIPFITGDGSTPVPVRLMIGGFFGLIAGEIVSSILGPPRYGPRYKSSDSGAGGCGSGCGGCG